MQSKIWTNPRIHGKEWIPPIENVVQQANDLNTETPVVTNSTGTTGSDTINGCEKILVQKTNTI